MHIAFDLDDVVLDFIGGVRRSFQLEFGEEGIPGYQGSPWGQEVVDFYHHPYFLECGYEDWWDWLRDRDWLWGNVFEAVPGAIGSIKRLRKAGHYVECVTSKPEWAEFAVWQFQGRYRAPFQRITIVGVGETKLDNTDAALIVDDKLATVEEFVEAGRSGILFDPGYVYKSDRATGVARNWADVVNLVEVINDDN